MQAKYSTAIFVHRPILLLVLNVLLGAASFCMVGCRSTVPIHVWQPAQVETLGSATVALMPISGDPELARHIEQAFLAQRPSASADIALFTAEQLVERSPIRLVSTAAMSSDLVAIHAARSIGTDLLVQGEILSAKIDALPEQERVQENINMNEAFFQPRKQNQPKNESLLLSWRVIDTKTSETLGARSFTIRTQDAALQYPDLVLAYQDGTAMLIAAAARETWKSLSPYVAKEDVRLAVPWLQPGAWRVRRGVRAARRGQWEQAEEQWQKAANQFWLNASAHHNLAVAMAAREDFSSAKRQIMKARGSLAIRLPSETLFWLEKNHRRYQQAHGLGTPAEGWAFPEPTSSPSLELVEPIDVDSLPWWTAIPFSKPPGWSWENWLTQPLVL